MKSNRDHKWIVRWNYQCLCYLCIVVMTLSSCGLLKKHSSDSLTANDQCQLMPKPRVEIVHGISPQAQSIILDQLTLELRNSLVQEARVHIVDAIGGPVQPIAFSENLETLELQTPGLPLPTVTDPMWINPSGQTDYEIIVTVDDFFPYRPMRLSATVKIVDPVSGIEVAVIQKTWNGIPHRDTTPTKLLSRRERYRLTHTAKVVNDVHEVSPSQLISQAAHELSHLISAHCNPPVAPGLASKE